MDDRPTDATFVLGPASPERTRHRRSIWLGLSCLIVVLAGTVAVIGTRDDPVEVAAAGRTPAPVRSPGTTTSPPWAVPAAVEMVTTTVTTLRSGDDDRPVKVPTPAEFEAENSCIPGSYETGPGFTQCTPHPRYVAGRVTDPSGAPLAGVCVTGFPASVLARTDADGRYSIKDGPTGALGFGSCPDSTASFGLVPVRVWQDQYPPAGTTFTRPDVVLQRSGGVRGRVVDLDGDPVAGVCVTSPTIDEQVSRATDLNGTFSLAGVLPGPQPIGFRIGTVACPTVGIWDPNPDVVIRPGEWTDTTLRMQPGQNLSPLQP